MQWEVQVSRCKLVCIEWINNKVLLYSTENYIQYPRMNHNGEEYFLKECVCVCVCVCVCLEESVCHTAEINIKKEKIIEEKHTELKNNLKSYIERMY